MNAAGRPLDSAIIHECCKSPPAWDHRDVIPASVERLLQDGTREAVQEMLEDRKAVFLVDWREEDDAIVGYAEDILQTGLAAELVGIDDDPGFALYISHKGKREQVPLVAGNEDRHITLHAVNALLRPGHEIRVCVDSRGSDTLAFLPLAGADWTALEARFGNKVAAHFRKIEAHPNLFTERW
jgi:hypothetical protein